MRSLCLAFLISIAGPVFAQDSVLLHGHVANRKSDSVKVLYNDNYIAYYPREFYAPLNRNGDFDLRFPVPAGRYVQAEIAHGGRSAELLLKPGDSLQMNLDVARFDSSIHFSGRGAAAANFMALHTLKLGRMNQYTIRVKTAINKEPAEFLKNIAAEKKTELDFLEKNKEGLPADFIQYWKAFYQYYNYFFIQQYPQVHEMIRRKKFTDSVPETNYVVVKEMPLAFNDSLLQVPSYLLYLTGVLDTKLKAAGYYYLGNDEQQFYKVQDSVYKLAYKKMPDASAEYYLAQDLYGRARNQDLARTELLYKKFRHRWPHSAYMTYLDKQVNMAKKLAPGEPAPDFEIHADGVLKHLSDLKGKVVYIVFWAGWCKQCVGELVNGKKVTDLLKNKPFEMVHLSLNTDTATDRKLIDKFQFAGSFTSLRGIWNAKEVQDYGVQSLPAYYLIDEEGNFAMRNPPSPNQSTQLILEIGKLMK